MTRKNKNNARQSNNRPAKTVITTTRVVKPKPKRSGQSYKQSNPTVSRSLIEKVCSITDPFCSAARGSKYPDSATLRTMAFPFHSRVVVTTDAGGSAAFLVLPAYTYYGASPSISGSTATYTTATTTGPSLSIDTFRIVSMGIKLRNVCAPLTSSGMVRIRGLNGQTGAAFGTIDTLGYNCDYYEDVPLQDVKEVAVVLKRVGPLSQFFVTPASIQPSSTVTAWVSPGWGPVQVSMTGCVASTQVLDVEVYINYEVTFVDSDSMSLAMTPAPPANGLVTQVSSVVSQTATNVFVKGAEQAAGAVFNAARKAVIGAIAARIGGPMAGLTAITVD